MHFECTTNVFECTEMQSEPFKCRRMPSIALKYLQKHSNAFKCKHMRAHALKYIQMRSGAFKCIQNSCAFQAIKCVQMQSDAFKCMQLCLNVLYLHFECILNVFEFPNAFKCTSMQATVFQRTEMQSEAFKCIQ